MIISLIGFMGAGKTTIGKQLAQSIKCPFIDLDAYIEEKEGKTISEIFEAVSEAGFREKELNYLQDILEDHITQHPETLDDLPPFTPESTADDAPVATRGCTMVLSLGGGIVTNPECADLISRFTYCMYIHTDIEVIKQRLSQQAEAAGRPMLGGESGDALLARIEKLYKERTPLYTRLARKTYFL
jgi:shikimate kinase